MGDFVTVSAFRNRSVDEVVEALGAFAVQHGSRAEVVRAGDAGEVEDDDEVAHVTAPRNGWTVVLWPLFTYGDAPLYAELSRIAHTLLSTVQVYDSDAWDHLLLNDGQVLDKFSSDPTGQAVTAAPTAEEIERLREEWRGQPELLAAQFGVSPEVIRPYFEFQPRATEREAEGGVKGWLRRFGLGSHRARREVIKAFPDDEHDIRDTWVFTDFWRRLGIHYPDGEHASDLLIRFSPNFLRPELPAT